MDTMGARSRETQTHIICREGIYWDGNPLVERVQSRSHLT